MHFLSRFSGTRYSSSNQRRLDAVVLPGCVSVLVLADPVQGVLAAKVEVVSYNRGRCGELCVQFVDGENFEGWAVLEDVGRAVSTGDVDAVRCGDE